MNQRFLCLFLGLALTPYALAHGPIHEQIENVTRRIEREPGNAELYIVTALNNSGAESQYSNMASAKAR